MQENKNKKKSEKPTQANQPGLSHIPANATHVLFANNGEKDPATGNTIPSESAVESASNSIKENKK
jgi:hypothetical protein